MFGVEALVAMFLAGAFCGAYGWHVYFRARPRYAWPELDTLADRLTAIERRGKMLQGRLNTLHPPREGTGANGEDSAVPEVTAAAAVLPGSRAALLAAALRRANARDK